MGIGLCADDGAQQYGWRMTQVWPSPLTSQAGGVTFVRDCYWFLDRCEGSGGTSKAASQIRHNPERLAGPR
jgi:hypothetical protein